jgi:hydrogenase maturation protease
VNEWEWRLLEERPGVELLRIAGADVARGSRVRLHPRRGGDAQDLLLAGKTATIESIEQDYEGTVHLAVVLDDDPGRDLGFMRQPGHRFFFSPEDVEPLAQDDAAAHAQANANANAWPAPMAGARPAILVAGIGNIFLGDDGFGVEVVRRLQGRALPDGVRVADFGIRGLDLAYALMDASDVTILVDAAPRGGEPGTLYLIEPELAPADEGSREPALLEPHAMNPMNVIRAAQTMGGELKKILLLGCEPATLGPPEGQLGLSDRVDAAVDEAVRLLQELVRDIRNGRWPHDGQTQTPA